MVFSGVQGNGVKRTRFSGYSVKISVSVEIFINVFLFLSCWHTETGVAFKEKQHEGILCLSPFPPFLKAIPFNQRKFAVIQTVRLQPGSGKEFRDRTLKNLFFPVKVRPDVYREAVFWIKQT